MLKKSELLLIAKDRVLISLFLVALIELIVVLITTMVRLHASDVQVPVRYSGYGTANIYRGQWFTIWSFVIFAILVVTLNGFVALKAHSLSKMMSRGIMGFSVFVLVVEMFVLNAVLNLAPSI